MYSVVCSAGEIDNIFQQNHTSSSYSVYADDDDSPDETPSIDAEKRDMPYTNSQPQRASLRPPPPPTTNQEKGRSRLSHSIVRNRSSLLPAQLLDTGLDSGRMAPYLESSSQQYPTTGTSDIVYAPFARTIPDEVVLRPPTLPFASRANNQSKNRPSSYGSNNTFGAIDGNSNPSSPVLDDGSSQISSYMDYHQRTHSGSSISNHPNGNVFYAASSGIPSNHTLGGSLQLNSHTKKPSSHHYTSSEEEDTDRRQFGTSSSCSGSSLCSGGHPGSNCTATLSKKLPDDTLFQRIDDYLHEAQERK
ncbi:hypothetical protein BD408DRAFT_430147 [Parasitella parasitica]|nr:hypothetical protein BD408DRAFT_430147 [Parasitella parasitica]